MKPEIEYVYNKLKRLRFDFKSSDFRDFRSYYRYDPELMRYVRKDDNDLFIAKDTFKPLEEELEYADKCHNLEEQLGCPLEVVIKALQNGVYYEDVANNMRYMVADLHYNLAGDFVFYFDDEECLLARNYKKTWWLKKDKSE